MTVRLRSAGGRAGRAAGRSPRTLELGVRTWGNDPDGSTAALMGCYPFCGEVSGRLLDARALHADPARPWTVAELARVAGVSRGLFARRSTEQVGEPPIAHLTGWRLALAADLLLEPDATLGSVARRVGYGDGFALSTAFKRVRGISPAEHRSHG